MNHLLQKTESITTIHCLEGMQRENEYWTKLFGCFVKNLNKILSNFATFETEMEMEMTDDQKITQRSNSLLLMR